MKFSLFVFVIGLVSTAQANISFTQDEIRDQQKNIQTITSTASKCLEATYADHLQFFKKWGVSKYYGDRNPIFNTTELRRQQLRKYGAPVSLESELTPTSCVGLTAKCLGEGFAAAGRQDVWKKVLTQLRSKDMDGTDLQRSLQMLGWKILYWNPNPENNAAWDADDQNLNPLKPGKKWNAVWGGHAYNYKLVMNKNIYYGIPVDDKTTLVGFKDQTPATFKAQPFFVGTAHSGYHVFSGINGEVIEAHSMRALNSIDNLQVSPFNPLATGGGPRWTRTEKYRSGIVAIPPSPL